MTWLTSLWHALTPFVDRLKFDAYIPPRGFPVTARKTIKGKASSFADPKDVLSFKRCTSQGKTDQQCFAVGDNGIGCWGDNTAQTTIPMCALPPDDMVARWRTVAAAKHRLVAVRIGTKTITCKLADRMPWKRNIKNGAVIDLNPAAVKALGLTPPIMEQAEWWWLE